MFSLMQFLVGCLALTTIAQDGGHNDLGTRWRREYPAAANELEKIASSFTAKGAYTFNYFNGDVSITRDFTIASSGDRRLITRDGIDYVAKEQGKKFVPPDVNCIKPDLVFRLKRQVAGGPFTLAGIAGRERDDDNEFNITYNRVARGATVYIGRSLLFRMQSSSFVMKSIESLMEGGSEIVRVEYAWEDENSSEFGSVFLEPQRKWAIRRVEITSTYKKDSIPTPVSFRCEVRYRDFADGRSFPSHADFKTKIPVSGALEHVIVDLEEIKLGDVPDQIFKLSAYGLPDVPLRPARQATAFSFHNPWLWVSFATAVVSFALLWIMRDRRGRVVS